MKIIFAGHFTIGEKISPTHLKTILEAKKLNGDLAILLNDIDFKRKLQFFDIGGEEMVLKHYGSRKKCGTTKPLCQLPEYHELPDLIDWNFYKIALKKIKKSSSKIEEVLRTEIVPMAINSALKLYGLNKNSVKIFSEHQLRNRASLRLANRKKNSKNSWLPILKKTKILEEVRASISKIPVCSGIQLALFEKISEKGYSSLTELCAKADQKAIEKGLKLCRILNRNYPRDPRWSIKSEYLYF